MNGPVLGLGDIEQDLWVLLFIMTRIGAALLAAPIFGAASIPPQIRLILTGAVAVFVMIWVPVKLPVDVFSFAALVGLVGEAVIGLALGFTLQLSFAAPIIAGEQIAGGMGMAIATAIDPNTGARSGALGQYFSIVLTLTFLAIGGHLLWLRLVIESYIAFPPGEAWIGPDRAKMIVGFASQMFATAMAIALPVLLVLFLVQMATGVLSRSAPQLNLFALGLPAGILGGLAALLASVPIMSEHFVSLSQVMIQQAGQVVAP